MKALYLFFLLIPLCSQAQDTLFKSSVEELMNLKPIENSMESLLNREVVSASNTAEKLSEAPASIIVLTQKQIMDRGYLNLVELLKDMLLGFPAHADTPVNKRQENTFVMVGGNND